MAEPETRSTTTPFASYLEGIVDEERRVDCEVVADLMHFATGQPAVLWGTGIVGFGRYTLQYAGGRVADWPVIAFASRKADMALYINSATSFPHVLGELGKYKTGGGCLYVRALENVDIPTLAQLIALGVESRQAVRTE